MMAERCGAELRVGDSVRIVETEGAPSMGATLPQ
jgi:hypothetical protein